MTTAPLPSCSERLFQWEQLPPLPDAHGFAGAFAGVSGGALIVAGGANFPGAKPWEGGKKQWHRTAFMLADKAITWSETTSLPHPLAYGVSLSTDAGVLCIGGEDGTRCYGGAFLLKRSGSELVREELSALPRPLANAAGVLAGRKAYVVGGIESPSGTTASASLLMLDLDAPAKGWSELEPLPGPGRIFPVVAALGGTVYVCSGANLAAGADGKTVRTYLRDAYSYAPGKGWRRLADLPRPTVAAPSPAVTSGGSSFFIFGGDDGSLAGVKPGPDHPGFARGVLRYDTVTNTWSPCAEVPASRVTTPLVPWKGSCVIPSGEMRPGVRSPQVWSARVVLR